MGCRHCGYERPTPQVCPECGSVYIRYFGLGTEQVEQEVVKAFPEASVKRMDADSTGRKDAHQKILDAFRLGEIDILVGTPDDCERIRFSECDPCWRDLCRYCTKSTGFSCR